MSNSVRTPQYTVLYDKRQQIRFASGLDELMCLLGHLSGKFVEVVWLTRKGKSRVKMVDVSNDGETMNNHLIPSRKITTNDFIE